MEVEITIAERTGVYRAVLPHAIDAADRLAIPGVQEVGAATRPHFRITDIFPQISSAIACPP